MACVVTRRPGFGLVEVLVAALLIAGGMLTVAAAAVSARARMAAARTDERGVRLAAALLDSLRTEIGVGAGATVRAGIHAEWHAERDEIVLTITLPGAITGERTRRYRIRSAMAIQDLDSP